MNHGNDSPAEPVLVEQLISADDQRRQLRKRGGGLSGSDLSGSELSQRHLSGIELSDQLDPQQREELSRMLECADQLEQLAARDGGRLPPTAVTNGSEQAADPGGPESAAGEQDTEDEYRIGHYHVLRLIADGGFGAVLLAVDERDDRQVALKVPRPDIHLTRRLQERFLTEGRAATTLNHPNIVAVYETLQEPVPAIAFEYCAGGPLSRAARRITDERTAIQLVLQLAQALQHAHTRGILHRDLKPGNVLLVRAGEADHDHAVEIDGEWWIPKLSDFGLAKVVDDSVNQTHTGIVMGTPQFMAPEQAAGRISELGTHTDVYSLGAIFYWLLVGQPPFDGKAPLQTLRMVESVEVEHPRRLRRDISPKTEAVCLKCLRKPIDARYPSAAALAEDLRNLLRGEPVSVRPPNPIERFRAWGHRNPKLAVFSIMLLLATALGMLLQWNSNRSLQQYVDELDAARSLAERQRYASDLQLAQSALDAGDVKTYEQALVRHIPAGARSPDLRGAEWQQLWDRGHIPSTPIDEFPSAAYFARLSQDGAYLTACGADATVRVYDTRTWERLAVIDTGQLEVNYAAFSSDGERIASAGDDGTLVVWEWRTGRPLIRIPAFEDAKAYSVQFYDDDSKLAACGRHEVIRLWEVETGEMLGELHSDGNPEMVEQLDISADQQWLASASRDGKRRVWNLQTHQPLQSLRPIDDQHLSSVCLFQREGEDWMISGTLRKGSRAKCGVILEVVGGEDQRILPIHFDGVQAVTVDRHAQLAAAGDGGGRISMIDINAAIRGERWWYPETIRKSWVGHTGRVYGLVMTDDGRTVISAGEDGRLMRWHTDRQPGLSTRQAEPGRSWVHAAVSPQQAIYLVDSPGGDSSGQVYRWHPEEDRLTTITEGDSNRPLRIEPGTERAFGSLAAFAGRIFAKRHQGPLCCWELDGSRARLKWDAGGEVTAAPGDVSEMTLSAEGTLLAIWRQGQPRRHLVLDARTGKFRHEIAVTFRFAPVCRAMAFDHSASRLAFGADESVIVHTLKTGSQMRLSGHEEEVRQIFFVPGSNLMLSGAEDRTICVWDLATGELVQKLTGHRAAIECLGLHSHGNRLVSADSMGEVRFWSLEDRMLLAELPPPAENTWHVACGERLVGITAGRTAFEKRLLAPEQ